MMRRAMLLPLLLVGASPLAGHSPNIRFEATLIDPGASETAAVADINRDGLKDIVSGEYWYAAPGWSQHQFRSLDHISGYIDNFTDLTIDVDSDGWTDIVSVRWFGERISWFRNPGRPEGLWVEELIHKGANVEFAMLADVDNDGRALELVAQETDGQAWYRVEKGKWIRHQVAPHNLGHGIGVGDVDRDGRNDILTPAGWLQAPEDPASPDWKFHAGWAAVNPSSSGRSRTMMLGFMYALDINGDGRNDILSSAAHDYGILWFEQQGDGSWVRHFIDRTWSQAHASALADLNGDGKLDFVTGKRFMAHNGSDPGEREPLGVYWYEREEPKNGDERAAPSSWVRHVIEYGGRIGAGQQLQVADIDGDGDLDLICPGKTGLFLLRNLSR